MIPLGSSQRLFVTPDEHARRMAAQNNKHPHGGEGNCGGTEGHGTPELLRKKTGASKPSAADAVGAAGNASHNASVATKTNVPQNRSSDRNDRNNV